MTNREKYGEQILDFLENGDHNIAIVKGKPVPCNACDCSECQLDGACHSNFAEWLKEEYKEPIVLNMFERKMVELLDSYGYAYIARDRGMNDADSGGLYAYKSMPIKGYSMYSESTEDSMYQIGYLFSERLFKFIQFDKGVFDIRDMLSWEVKEE